MKKRITPLCLYKSNKSTLLYFILSAVFLISSCEPCIDDGEEKVFPVFITPILVAKGNGISFMPLPISPQNLVITTRGTWNDLLASFSEYEIELQFQETDIDFSVYQAIVVIDKDRDYEASITITNITEYADEIGVSYATAGPLSINPVCSQPFHIVKIPKSQKEVIFTHI